MPEEIQKAQQRVEQELERLKAGPAQVHALTADAVVHVLSKDLFVAVIFRHYPVAIRPPAPLKPSDLFAVSRAGEAKPRLLTDAKDLETFFRESLGPVRDDAQTKEVVRAWLELAPVFVQDGFYQFSVVPETITVSHEGAVRKTAGKVVVMKGGNGQIDVAMEFDPAGKLVRVEHTAKVRPGPRPICQATKLLDADPLVRRMAEQDLLIMGRPARAYLEEQRAQAAPGLKQAIDQLWQRILDEDP
jgi:hypothetical protein